MSGGGGGGRRPAGLREFFVADRTYSSCLRFYCEGFNQ